ncbi:WapI family immunity protein [Lactiplantibacillus fabifermentans]|uniref:Uncharacterized protein n=2 Tax=Lactiplantibacillus fabifermentans TaxID=483011 RepID=A0A0R2NQC6_9LACO|nr:hypothetical protein [Lactiplantibacillus fabifermentans]ETY74576.1 hypothetical protein LFAB_06685 [Lactiplantibacillus fabifermentans T30PCM01]KRO27910.1 hypothetical protein DY78_GL002814 [Lactiplantibacillus fabifermentans DSM 21115]
MNNLELDIDGTLLEFNVTDVGDHSRDAWTNATLRVKNEYFNMNIATTFLSYPELKEISTTLDKLVKDELRPMSLAFIEPYLEIEFNRTHDQQIVCELLLYPEIDSMFTNQHYNLPLDWSHVLKLQKFLSQRLAVL